MAGAACVLGRLGDNLYKKCISLVGTCTSVDGYDKVGGYQARG